MRVAQRTLRRSPPAVAAADVTQSLHKRLRTGPLVAGDGEYCRPPCRGRVRDPTAASIASQPSATVHRSSMQSARVLTRVAWAQYGTACAAAYQPGGSRFLKPRESNSCRVHAAACRLRGAEAVYRSRFHMQFSPSASFGGDQGIACVTPSHDGSRSTWIVECRMPKRLARTR